MATITHDVQMHRSQNSLVWKFGYGSNMSLENLRQKKGLDPKEAKQVVLKDFALSFPAGGGIDLVEPSFATLKKQTGQEVHGVAALMSVADAKNLDGQEGSYIVELHPTKTYDGETLTVEVYVSKDLAPDHPESCCSDRYRALLVRGAKENNLAPEWIEKLQDLPVYEPSAETLQARDSLPAPSALPAMSIEELARHDGTDKQRPIYVSSCGYIFEHTPIFKVMRGRDVTNRNVMHYRGINLRLNDDGGKSPFPRLSELGPGELEYALRYRDRFTSKCVGGKPIAVLREFWEDQ